MAQPPAFQFYASDYLSSSTVQRMTLEAEGAYCRLLFYSWQDGSIPSDIRELASLCKTTPKRMAVLWDVYIKGCWTPMESAPHRLVNARMEQVRGGLSRFSESQSKRATAGWETRRKTDARASDGHSPTDAGGHESGNALQSSVFNLQSSVLKPLSDKSDDGGFSEFWDGSTKRGSRKAALKVWTRVKPIALLQEEIRDGMARWMRSEQWQDENMQPHISTWLNRNGWEEIVPRSTGKTVTARTGADTPDYYEGLKGFE